MTYISGLTSEITVAPTYAQLPGIYLAVDNTNTNTSQKCAGQNWYKLFVNALPFGWDGGDPDNTTTGADAAVFGKSNTASGDYSYSMGNTCTAGGEYSAAIGINSKTTIDNTIEVGYWITPTVRESAIRLQAGRVSFTFVDSATAPTDGGATAGSEADGTLPRGMMAFRVNGTEVWVDVNVGGIVTSTQLNLGV